MYVCVCMGACVHGCMCACVYVSMCVCACMWCVCDPCVCVFFLSLGQSDDPLYFLESTLGKASGPVGKMLRSFFCCQSQVWQESIFCCCDEMLGAFPL